MIALLTPIAGAVFLALMRRRMVSGLMQQHIVWWQFGCAALAAEVALSSTSLGRHQWVADWGSTIWVGALAVMVVVLARNALARSSAARGAWAVAAVGVLLNLVVVAANGGQMPQSQEARIAAGASVERVAGLASESGWRNVAPMTADTRLPLLGDILPEPAWLPMRNVISVGDVLLALGLAAACYLSTSPRPRRRQA